MTNQELYDMVHASLQTSPAFTFTYDTPELNIQLAAKRLDTENAVVNFINTYTGVLNPIKVDKLLSFVLGYLENYAGEESLDKLKIILDFIRKYIPHYVDEVLSGVLLYSFDDIDDFCVAFFPEHLYTVSDYRVLITLLAVQGLKCEEMLGKYYNLYNVPLTDASFLPRLADTLSFSYPPKYDYEDLRTILCYLSKIKRSRGQIKAIKQILRLLYITRDELTQLTIEDYNDIKVYEVDDSNQPVLEDYSNNDIDGNSHSITGCRQSGILLIEYNPDRFIEPISNDPFAKAMIDIVKPIGYKVLFKN